MAKTLKTLGENPAKVDEIAFLEAVSGSIPNDSYLAQLFTREFMVWATTSIRDDGFLDIYLFWLEAQRKQRDAEDKCVAYADENRVFKESAEAMRKQIVDLQTTVKTMREANNEMQYNANALLMQFDEVRKDLDNEKKTSAAQMREISALKRMITAVVNDTQENDIQTTARMLVQAWKEADSPK